LLIQDGKSVQTALSWKNAMQPSRRKWSSFATKPEGFNDSNSCPYFSNSNGSMMSQRKDFQRIALAPLGGYYF
jgi:hypothetical protein